MAEIFCIGEHDLLLNKLIERNIENSMILHFDFHIDAAWFDISKLEIYKSNDTIHDLLPFREQLWFDNKKINGIHCGNFLYYTFRNKIIKHFIWVMPNEKRSSYEIYNKVSRNLGGISKEDFLNTKSENGIIRGKIYDVNITVLTIDKLHEVNDEILSYPNDVILDIDLDYFLDIYTKFTWINMKHFTNKIDNIIDKCNYVCICDSIASGHTPSVYGYIKDYLLNYMQGKDINNQLMIEKSINDIINKDSLTNILQYNELDCNEKAKILINSYIPATKNEIENISNEISNNFMKALLIMRISYEKSLPMFKTSENEYQCVRFLSKYAEILLYCCEYNKALKVLARIETKDRLWDVYYKLGICYYNLHEYQKAMSAFEKAKDMNPIYDRIYYCIMQCAKMIKTDLDVVKYKKIYQMLYNKNKES